MRGTQAHRTTWQRWTLVPACAIRAQNSTQSYAVSLLLQTFHAAPLTVHSLPHHRLLHGTAHCLPTTGCCLLTARHVALFARRLIMWACGTFVTCRLATCRPARRRFTRDAAERRLQRRVEVLRLRSRVEVYFRKPLQLFATPCPLWR